MTVAPRCSASMKIGERGILATMGMPTASENLSTRESSSGSPRLLNMMPPILSGL